MRILRLGRNALRLYVKDVKYWLLAIAAALITLDLSLAFRSASNDVLSMSVLFWIAGGSFVWKKRCGLSLNSGVLSSLLGTILVGLLFVKSANVSSSTHFVRVFPLISVLGLGLLASGVKGLKQYWQVFLLFGFVAIPPGLISLFVDISVFTAKFSAFVLGLLGFAVSRQGVNVILPTGFIEVYPGCSGMAVILQLLGIAVIFLVMLSSTLIKKVLVICAAIVIGFIVNGLRVALMAVLVASHDQEAFNYWHLGTGSLIFSIVAVVMFAAFYDFVGQVGALNR